MISARINSVQSHQSHEVVGFQSAGYLSISFTLLYRLTINKKSTEVNRSQPKSTWNFQNAVGLWNGLLWWGAGRARSVKPEVISWLRHNETMTITKGHPNFIQFHMTLQEVTPQKIIREVQVKQGRTSFQGCSMDNPVRICKDQNMSQPTCIAWSKKAVFCILATPAVWRHKGKNSKTMKTLPENLHAAWASDLIESI